MRFRQHIDLERPCLLVGKEKEVGILNIGNSIIEMSLHYSSRASEAQTGTFHLFLTLW